MFCTVCAAPAVWLVDLAGGGVNEVRHACGEHVNRVLSDAGVDCIVSRRTPPSPVLTGTERCRVCGRRQGWDGHPYAPCALDVWSGNPATDKAWARG